MYRVLLFAGLLAGGTVWGAEVVSRRALCEKVLAAVGASPQETVQRIGKPRAQKTVRVENPHLPEAHDTLTTLTYPGGHVLFAYLDYPDRYVLLEATLPVQQLSTELRGVVPETFDEVLVRWGAPDDQSVNRLRYHCSAEGLEWIDLGWKAGRITEFSFTGYID
jgi:hypothetical protein